MTEEGYDLYGDLDQLSIEQKLKEKNEDYNKLEKKYKNALKTIKNLQNEIKELKNSIETINKNFSSLLLTAKSELKRKDNQIATLRKEKDDICFRRFGRHQIPNSQFIPTPSTSSSSFHESRKYEEENVFNNQLPNLKDRNTELVPSDKRFKSSSSSAFCHKKETEHENFKSSHRSLRDEESRKRRRSTYEERNLEYNKKDESGRRNESRNRDSRRGDVESDWNKEDRKDESSKRIESRVDDSKRRKNDWDKEGKNDERTKRDPSRNTNLKRKEIECDWHREDRYERSPKRIRRDVNFEDKNGIKMIRIEVSEKEGRHKSDKNGDIGTDRRKEDKEKSDKTHHKNYTEHKSSTKEKLPNDAHDLREKLEKLHKSKKFDDHQHQKDNEIHEKHSKSKREIENKEEKSKNDSISTVNNTEKIHKNNKILSLENEVEPEILKDIEIMKNVNVDQENTKENEKYIKKCQRSISHALEEALFGDDSEYERISEPTDLNSSRKNDTKQQNSNGMNVSDDIYGDLTLTSIPEINESIEGHKEYPEIPQSEGVNNENEIEKGGTREKNEKVGGKNSENRLMESSDVQEERQKEIYHTTDESTQIKSNNSIDDTVEHQVNEVGREIIAELEPKHEISGFDHETDHLANVQKMIESKIISEHPMVTIHTDCRRESFTQQEKNTTISSEKLKEIKSSNSPKTINIINVPENEVQNTSKNSENVLNETTTHSVSPENEDKDNPADTEKVTTSQTTENDLKKKYQDIINDCYVVIEPLVNNSPEIIPRKIPVTDELQKRTSSVVQTLLDSKITLDLQSQESSQSSSSTIKTSSVNISEKSEVITDNKRKRTPKKLSQSFGRPPKMIGHKIEGFEPGGPERSALEASKLMNVLFQDVLKPLPSSINNELEKGNKNTENSEQLNLVSDNNEISLENTVKEKSNISSSSLLKSNFKKGRRLTLEIFEENPIEDLKEMKKEKTHEKKGTKNYAKTNSKVKVMETVLAGGKVKRRRGRPRKYPLPESIIENKNVIDEEKIEKKPVEEMDSIEETIRAVNSILVFSEEDDENYPCCEYLETVSIGKESEIIEKPENLAEIDENHLRNESNVQVIETEIQGNEMSSKMKESVQEEEGNVVEMISEEINNVENEQKAENRGLLEVNSEKENSKQNDQEEAEKPNSEEEQITPKNVSEKVNKLSENNKNVEKEQPSIGKSSENVKNEINYSKKSKIFSNIENSLIENKSETTTITTPSLLLMSPSSPKSPHSKNRKKSNHSLNSEQIKQIIKNSKNDDELFDQVFRSPFQEPAQSPILNLHNSSGNISKDEIEKNIEEMFAENSELKETENSIRTNESPLESINKSDNENEQEPLGTNLEENNEPLIPDESRQTENVIESKKIMSSDSEKENTSLSQNVSLCDKIEKQQEQHDEQNPENVSCSGNASNNFDNSKDDDEQGSSMMDVSPNKSERKLFSNSFSDYVIETGEDNVINVFITRKKRKTKKKKS